MARRLVGGPPAGAVAVAHGNGNAVGGNGANRSGMRLVRRVLGGDDDSASGLLVALGRRCGELAVDQLCHGGDRRGHGRGRDWRWDPDVHLLRPSERDRDRPADGHEAVRCQGDVRGWLFGDGRNVVRAGGAFCGQVRDARGAAGARAVFGAGGGGEEQGVRAIDSDDVRGARTTERGVGTGAWARGSSGSGLATARHRSRSACVCWWPSGRRACDCYASCRCAIGCYAVCNRPVCNRPVCCRASCCYGSFSAIRWGRCSESRGISGPVRSRGGTGRRHGSFCE